MSNPILVEAKRGSVVENRHRGAISVVDAKGKTVLSVGDNERPIFPRSSIKSIIALPLVESGAAGAYGFGAKELALASSSHSGEAAHLALAGAMLAKAGLSEAALECGPSWPYGEQWPTGTRAYAAGGGKPARICHTCSGKHAGLICTAIFSGQDHQGYVTPNHIVQETVRRTLEEVTGAAHEERFRGTDGCSIPSYAIPLKNLALGMARMMTGEGLPQERAKAAQKIVAACMAEPDYVAGTGRMCTLLMAAVPGEIFAKFGADGVYALGLPKLGLGIALKCDDGSVGAAETMAAGILAYLLPQDHPAQGALIALSQADICAADGTIVGQRYSLTENFSAN